MPPPSEDLRSASQREYPELQGPDQPDGQGGADVSAFPADIPRVPWSQVAPEFIAAWGYPDGKFDPEHIEILGPSGSGKTVFEETILSERVAARDSAAVFVATKSADGQIKALSGAGWPIVSSVRQVLDREHKQSIYWPQTKLLGSEREEYLARKVNDLLSGLWHAGANRIVAFDEIATVEALSHETKKLIAMYWREARSLGLTIVAMKQRPQGIQRDMHSEAAWVVSFRPKDEDDAKRYAEIFGSRVYWQPVLMSLQRDKYEFLIQHARSGMAVISWIDMPIEPLPERRYEGRR